MAAAGPSAGDDHRRQARLSRDGDVVDATDLGRPQLDAVTVDVVRLGRCVDDDRAVVALGAFVDVPNGDHRAGQRGTGDAADAAALLDHAAVAGQLVGRLDTGPIGVGARLVGGGHSLTIRRRRRGPRPGDEERAGGR